MHKGICIIAMLSARGRAVKYCPARDGPGNRGVLVYTFIIIRQQLSQKVQKKWGYFRDIYGNRCLECGRLRPLCFSITANLNMLYSFTVGIKQSGVEPPHSRYLANRCIHFIYFSARFFAPKASYESQSSLVQQICSVILIKLS